ncbi:MAG: hypothetical protein ABH865_01380 [Candidatus Omnitrophota bacterium]
MKEVVLRGLDRRFRNGQSFLEYGLFIAVAVMVLLATQAYLKRGAQGQLQTWADYTGTPYAPGLMNSTENFHGNSRIIELELPGWGHPTTITWARGGYNSRAVKKYYSLDAVLVPKNGS